MDPYSTGRRPIVRRGALARLVRRIGFALVVSAGIMTVSILVLTVAYWFVEHEGQPQRGPFDWFYYTVITTRTIGFGDITTDTRAGKIITIFNALLPASLFFGVSVLMMQLFFAWLENGYRRFRMRQLSGHHVIVSDDELAESIVQEYVLEKRPFVCVGQTPFDQLPPRLQELLDENSYYTGDPTRDEVLQAVNIRKAEAVLIATGDDNVNMYVLVTARGLVPGIKTIVRVNRQETESKFRSVGADQLLPAGTMLGRMLSQAAVAPVALELLVRLQTGTAEPFLHQRTVAQGEVDQPVREVAPTAVALYRGGRYRFDLEGQSLQSGDVVLYIGDQGSPTR